MRNNNNDEENGSNDEPQNTKRLKKNWKKYWRLQSDWVEKTKGNLMVAATVIATMSFQVMANPPGGVWQQDEKCPPHNQTKTNNIQPVCLRKAGTSVLQHYEPKRIAYIGMLISSTVSFSASMSLILVIILGLRLRNRLIMAIMVWFMAAAVLGMVAAYYFAIALVHTFDEIPIIILAIYLLFWIALPCVILFSKLIQLLVWVIRKICCGRSRRSRSRLPTGLPTTHPVQDHSQA